MPAHPISSSLRVRLALAATTAVLGATSAGAVEPSYADWPPTPEWVALTNHLNACYTAIRDRCRIVAPSRVTSIHPPTFLYPTRDYERFANEVDRLAPYFVDYSATTNAGGGLPTDFPTWTAETLRAACGFNEWATNNILTLWMLSDHRVQTQLTAAIDRLVWTKADATVDPAEPGAGRYLGEGFGWAEAASDYARVGSSAALPYAIVDRGGSPTNFHYANGTEVSETLLSGDWTRRQVPWNPWAAGAARNWNYRARMTVTVTMRTRRGLDPDVRMSGNGEWYFWVPRVYSHVDTVATVARTVPVPYNAAFMNSRFIVSWESPAQSEVDITTRLDDMTFVSDFVSIERGSQVLEATGLYTGLPSERTLYARGAPVAGSYPLLPNFAWETDAGPAPTPGEYSELYATVSTAAVERFTGFLHTNQVTTESEIVQRGWGIDAASWLIRWDVEGGLRPLAPSTSSAPTVLSPDTDRDGIVDVGLDLAAFGPDTGAIVHHPDFEPPLVVVPLAATTPWHGGPAVHAYVSQGGFQHLPYQYLAADDLLYDDIVDGVFDSAFWENWRVDDVAHYQFFSFGARILETGVGDAGGQPVKRTAVLRPMGQVVVFEFAESGGQFDAIGYPIGIHSNRSYVLRDLTPAAHDDYRYELHFDSGVVHEFGVLFQYAPLFLGIGAAGWLEAVRLADGRRSDAGSTGSGGFANVYEGPSMNVTWSNTVYLSPFFGFSRTPESAADSRYDVSWERERGQLKSIHYGTKNGAATVTTTLDYDVDGFIVSLTKTGIPGIERSGSAYDSATGTVSNGWETTVRTQTAGAGTARTVTVVRDIAAIGALSEEFDFNAADRLVEYRLAANGTAATTAWTYVAAPGRYSNGMVRAANVERIDYPNGSRADFAYEADSGWPASRSEPIGNGLSRAWTYDYEPAVAEGDTGDPPDPASLVERPRRVDLAIDGTHVARTWFSHTDTSRIIVKRAAAAGARWDAPENLATTNDFRAFDYLPSEIRDPISTRSFTYGLGGFAFATFVSDSGGETRTTRGNVHGDVLQLTTAENGHTTRSRSSRTDGFARPLRTDFIDGSFTDNQSWHFLGPPETIDIDGSTVGYLYYSNGWVKRINRPAFDRTTEFEYDPLGNITRRIETGGGLSVEHSWTYDALGRVTGATDPVGTTTYAYSQQPFGTRMTVTNPDGGTWTEDRHFDSSLREISGDAVVSHRRYAYGVEAGRQFEKEIRVGDGGETTEFVTTYFNMLGNPAEVQRSGRAGSILLAEDAAGRVEAVSDELGVTRRRTWNARNEVEHSGRVVGGVGPLDFTRDRVQTAARTVDANGVRRDVAVYPEDGVATPAQLASACRSLDTRTRTVALGDLGATRVRGPYSSPGVYTVTETSTDGTSIVTDYRKWLPETVTAYDAGSNILARESYAYDGLDFLVSVSNSHSGVATFAPDAARRLASSDPPDKGPTVLTYEPGTRRVATRALPDGNVERFEYFPNGLLARRHAGGQYDVRYEYDSQGRRTKQTTLRDGRGVDTEWRYDAATGELEAKLIDGVEVENYFWRDNGQPAAYVDANGVVATVLYTPDNDPVGVDYGDGTPTETITGIDRLNRPTGSASAVADDYRYTLDGRVLTNVVTGNGVVPDATIAYAYRPGEPNFAETTYAVAGAPTRIVAFTNDAGGRVDAIVAGSIAVEYGYEPDSDLVGSVVVRKNGVAILERTIVWDPVGQRVAAISNVCDGVVVASFAYGYDPESDRIVRVDLEDGGRWDYGYDELLHLASACRFSAGGLVVPGLDFAYGYDSIGNPTNAGPVDAGEPLYDFVANDRNEHVLRNWSDKVDVLGTSPTDVTVTINDDSVMRLGTWFCARLSVDNAAAAVEADVDVHAVRRLASNDLVAAVEGSVYAPQGAEAPASDLRGARTADSRFTFEYDARERLIEAASIATDPRTQVRFAYYADGRRARKEVYLDDGGLWELERVHQFVYDGWNLIFESIDDHSVAHDPATPDASRWRRYQWGLDIGGQRSGSSAAMQSAGGVGGLLTIETSEGATYVPVPDHVGSVCKLLDADTREIVAEYLYDPFGRLIGEFGPAAADCPFRFNTKYYDAETELYYYGLRYYDPAGMKWLTRDPIGERGGENLYAFADNDPVNNFDPLGLTSTRSRISRAGLLLREVEGGSFIVGLPLESQSINSRGVAGPWRRTRQAFVLDVALPSAEIDADVYALLYDTAVQLFAAEGEIRRLENAAVTLESAVDLAPGGNAIRLATEGDFGGAAVSLGIEGAITVGTVGLGRGYVLYRAGGRAAVRGAVGGALRRGVTLADPRNWRLVDPSRMASFPGNVRPRFVGPRTAGGSGALDIVPARYRGAIARSFRGDPELIELSEPLIVYRRWGDRASELGSPWFSPKPYVRPGNAQRYLALPEGNTAQNLTRFEIPAGTRILRGKVASQAGEAGFGANAVGGGVQIYLPDPSLAVPLR